MASQDSLDEMFLALANVHRRQILVALLEHNPQKSGSLDLPEGVRFDERERGNLQAMIFHNHLPKLEEAGFIRWESETGTVEKGPRFEEIRPVLELLNDNADDLPRDWL